MDITNKEKTYRILSIDAWNGCCAGCGCEEGSETCWTWNAWYPVGNFTGNIDGDVIRQLVDAGFLKDTAIEGCRIEDDGWNVIVCRKDNCEPLYAIEYGDSE